MYVIIMSEEKKQLETLWTVKQVAEYLSLSKITVYRWLMEERVIDPDKVVRFGNRVRIPRSEVQRIVGLTKDKIKKS